MYTNMRPDDFLSSLLSLSDAIDSARCLSRKVIASNLDSLLDRIGRYASTSHQVVESQDHTYELKNDKVLNYLYDHLDKDIDIQRKQHESRLKDLRLAMAAFQNSSKLDAKVREPVLLKIYDDLRKEYSDFPLIEDVFTLGEELTTYIQNFSNKKYSDEEIEEERSKYTNPDWLRKNIHDPVLLEAVKREQPSDWAILDIPDNKYLVVKKDDKRLPYKEGGSGYILISPNAELAKVQRIIDNYTKQKDLRITNPKDPVSKYDYNTRLDLLIPKIKGFPEWTTLNGILKDIESQMSHLDHFSTSISPDFTVDSYLENFLPSFVFYEYMLLPAQKDLVLKSFPRSGSKLVNDKETFRKYLRSNYLVRQRMDEETDVERQGEYKKELDLVMDYLKKKYDHDMLNNAKRNIQDLKNRYETMRKQLDDQGKIESLADRIPVSAMDAEIKIYESYKTLLEDPDKFGNDPWVKIPASV